ncbi:MAG: precorrin-2 C(20)-methyltransferase [Chloroflexota bacterium]
MPYELTAVGLGPGDPELITLKGFRALQAANFIFVPQSKGGEQSLALRIAQPHIDPTRQQVIALALPMTRNSQELIPAWQAAADTIWQTLDEAGQGEESNHPQKTYRAVYLLLGDPLLYGTFTYIWTEIAQRYPQISVQIVPGITSFAATAATVGMPLSATSDRVAILPASYETDTRTLHQLMAQFETVILMKAGPVLPQLLDVLSELNLIKSTIYAERVGMPEERVVTDLNQLPKEPAPYLSLLIVKRG